MAEDEFWGNDPKILVSSQRMTEFIPVAKMSYAEKLNSIVRFSIYLAILLYVYYQNYLVLYIPLLTMTITYLLYRFLIIDHDTVVGVPGEVSEEVLKSSHGQEIKETFDQTYSTDKEGNLCQLPTKNNPFMNVLLTDYVDNPNRPPACKINDVEEKVKSDFEHNLYKDVNDVWDKNNSQRQYYTNPGTTIPNDRDSFMNWCWNVPYVCKDGDQDACLKFERPYMHGKIF